MTMATRRVTVTHSVRAELVEVGDIIKVGNSWVKVTGHGEGTADTVDIEYTYTHIIDRGMHTVKTKPDAGNVQYQNFDLVQIQIDQMIMDVA